MDKYNFLRWDEIGNAIKYLYFNSNCGEFHMYTRVPESYKHADAHHRKIFQNLLKFWSF